MEVFCKLLLYVIFIPASYNAIPVKKSNEIQSTQYQNHQNAIKDYRHYQDFWQTPFQLQLQALRLQHLTQLLQILQFITIPASCAEGLLVLLKMSKIIM